LTKINPMNEQNPNLEPQLTKISAEIQDLSIKVAGDSLSLLQLLRTLESLHREIQEGLFQASLPSSRQGLYSMLRDIEESGGWPYIERGRLQLLTAKFEAANTEPATEAD
jgi:hypothetical protein